MHGVFLIDRHRLHMHSLCNAFFIFSIRRLPYVDSVGFRYWDYRFLRKTRHLKKISFLSKIDFRKISFQYTGAIRKIDFKFRSHLRRLVIQLLLILMKLNSNPTVASQISACCETYLHKVDGLGTKVLSRRSVFKLRVTFKKVVLLVKFDVSRVSFRWKNQLANISFSLLGPVGLDRCSFFSFFFFLHGLPRGMVLEEKPLGQKLKKCADVPRCVRFKTCQT